MYLNIILTLLFLAIAWNGLTFSLLLAMMRKEGTSGRLEIDEQRAYTKGINTQMVKLHEEMLEELKRLRMEEEQ
jgi:hypothetical protein